jgi:hypothetical protein
MIVDFAEPWTMDFADKAGSRFRQPLRLAPCFGTLPFRFIIEVRMQFTNLLATGMGTDGNGTWEATPHVLASAQLSSSIFSHMKFLAYCQFQSIKALQVGLHLEKRFFHVD